MTRLSEINCYQVAEDMENLNCYQLDNKSEVNTWDYFIIFDPKLLYLG